MNPFEEALLKLNPNKGSLAKLYYQIKDAPMPEWATKPTDILPAADPQLQLGTGRPQYNFGPSEETEEGVKQAYLMAKEAALLNSAIPRRASSAFAGIAGAGAAALQGEPIGNAYMNWYNKTLAKGNELVEKLQGEPSLLMQAMDKQWFQPAVKELAKQTGDRALAEERVGMIMDMLMMKAPARGTGRSVISPTGVETPIKSKTPSNINKGLLATGAVAAAPLVAPYAEKYGATSPFDDTLLKELTDEDRMSGIEYLQSLTPDQLMAVGGTIAGKNLPSVLQKGVRNVTQNEQIRPTSSIVNRVANSAQQATIPGPSAVNNRTLPVRQPENAQRWSTVNGQPVKPVSIEDIDPRNPHPGVVLVHSSQVPGLDRWDPSKADPTTYTGKNISQGFWGATEEGANLHGEVRPENVTDQYLIRTENPISIKFEGDKNTQAAMIAAREAGHDVAFLYDDQGNRNVVHLKPEEGGVKNLKNTGEWSESPSMMHNWILPVTAATAALFADDDQQRALGLAGTMAVLPKSQRIAELQRLLRETPDPVKKREYGQQIKAIQSEGRENLPAPVSTEKPLIDPQGPRFQLKSLNALGQLPANMKLNGPDVIKYLGKRGIPKDEINSIFGDLGSRGINTAERWIEIGEQRAPKVGYEQFGGPRYEGPTENIRQMANHEIVQAVREGAVVVTEEGMEFGPTDATRLENFFHDFPNERVDWMHPSLVSGRPAPYQSYFDNLIQSENLEPGSYQIGRTKVELPKQPQTLDNIAQEIFGKNHSQLIPEGQRIVFYEYTHRSKSGRYVSPTWSESEHPDLASVKNPLGGVISATKRMPDGTTYSRMFEAQLPKIVKESGKSIEQTAKKVASERGEKWDELDDMVKGGYLEEARTKKANLPVPEPLAERAMEKALQDYVAESIAAGHKGIILATGEEIKDRWNSALRGVADEARYNPVTQELKLYKNGSPSAAQSQVPAKVPPDKLKEYVGGQEAADLLLAAKPTTESASWFDDIDGAKLLGTDWRINIDTDQFNKNVYFVENTRTKEVIGKKTFEEAKALAERRANVTDVGQHVLTDLSIDQRWPVIEYGEFEGGKYIPGKVANTLKRLTGGEIELVDVGEKRDLIHDRRDDGIYIMDNLSGEDVAGPFATRTEATAAKDKLQSEGAKQPFLRFPKDTPKTFSIYEWAAMTGLSAEIIRQYLNANDEEQKDLLSQFPKLAMIGTVATKGKSKEYTITPSKLNIPTKSLVADKIRSSAPESQPVVNWINYLKKQSQRNPGVMKVIRSLSKEKPTAKLDKETIATMLDEQTPQFKTVIGENPLYGGREIFIQNPSAPEMWTDQHYYLNERSELSENLIGRIRANDIDNLQDISQIQTSQLAPRELQKAFPEFAATTIKNDALLRGQKEVYIPTGETAEAIQSNKIPTSIKKLYDEMPKLFVDAITERVTKGSVESGAHIAMQVSKLLDLIWDSPKQELRQDIIDDLYLGADYATNWGVDAKEAAKLKSVIVNAQNNQEPITINYLIKNFINESTFDIALREGLFRNPRFKKPAEYNKIDLSRADLTPYLYGAVPLLIGDEDTSR